MWLASCTGYFCRSWKFHWCSNENFWIIVGSYSWARTSPEQQLKWQLTCFCRFPKVLWKAMHSWTWPPPSRKSSSSPSGSRSSSPSTSRSGCSLKELSFSQVKLKLALLSLKLWCTGQYSELFISYLTFIAFLKSLIRWAEGLGLHFSLRNDSSLHVPY